MIPDKPMKKTKTISTLATIFFLFSVLRPDLIWAQGAAPPGQSRQVFLAVLDLDISEGIPPQARISLSNILREKLWKTGRFRVVDRNNMERILKEQGFQLSDCTSKECAVKIGQMLGVEEMVTGNIDLLGKTYIISVQMTNVETGEIKKMASDRCSACELDQLIGSIDKVSAALAEVVGGVMTPTTPTPTKPTNAEPVIKSPEAKSEPLKSLEIPQKKINIPKVKPKGNGTVAKGFYYTGLSLALIGGLAGPALYKKWEIKHDYNKTPGIPYTIPETTMHPGAFTLFGVGGAGLLTATLSYLYMPSLSGRERAHLLEYSGIDIAATGLVLAGGFIISTQQEYGDDTDQNTINLHNEIVNNDNKFLYISLGVIGFGAVLSLVSFLAAPKAIISDQAERKSLMPMVAISPEIMAYPEGGGYLGTRMAF